MSVRVKYSSGSFFVWDADAVRVLREEHRIVGTLIGCLPRAPRQNTHLGLPLQLMPEEATLLLEKGLIEVQETLYEKPTAEEVNEYKQTRHENYIEQVDLFREERRAELKRNLPQIIEGKKAKRNKLLEERRKKGEEIDQVEFEEEVVLDPDTVEIPAIKEQHALVQLNLESVPRQNLTCRTVDWKFPGTEEEKLRYAVFKDMWERGHYLTAAAKFGGDFLVYPGDPSRFHSIFIAVCLPHNKPLTALDMISMGRLGSNVKKTVVVCSLNDQNELGYTSVQWTGIS